MRPLKVLLTATGCPGAATVIRHLKDNGERPLELIGTDMSRDKVGAHWCDRFYQVPAGDSADFIPTILDIVEKEQPDVLLPQSSAEVIPFSRAKADIEKLGTTVMVSPTQAIEEAENKLNLYRNMQDSQIVKVPDFQVAHSLDEFEKGLEKLGFPDRKVCFKPPVSKGTRGFRVLATELSRRDILLNHRPVDRLITLEEFKDIFKNDTQPFPELVLMEFIEGTEFTTDPLIHDGEVLLCPVKTRENERCGLAMKFELVDRPDLVEATHAICDQFDLEWLVNIQFIGQHLIELNARLSTFVFQPELNQPYLAIKLALGEVTPEEVRAYGEKVKIGRTAIRYYDQVFFEK